MGTSQRGGNLNAPHWQKVERLWSNRIYFWIFRQQNEAHHCEGPHCLSSLHICSHLKENRDLAKPAVPPRCLIFSTVSKYFVMFRHCFKRIDHALSVLFFHSSAWILSSHARTVDICSFFSRLSSVWTASYLAHRYCTCVLYFPCSLVYQNLTFLLTHGICVLAIMLASLPTLIPSFLCTYRDNALFILSTSLFWLCLEIGAKRNFCRLCYLKKI